jgi:FkbM family methyltransferase
MGRDHLADIRYILGSGAKIIFDVGANEGQTMLAMAATFPHAEIYSFEPNPEVFLRLAASASRFDSVHTHNVALGSRTGEAKLFRFAFDQTNSLLPKAPGAEQFVADPDYVEEVGTTQVNVDTIDAFCAAHAIERIDLLKS